MCACQRAVKTSHSWADKNQPVGGVHLSHNRPHNLLGIGLLRTNVLTERGVLGGWFFSAHRWLVFKCPVTVCGIKVCACSAAGVKRGMRNTREMKKECF